MTFSPCTNSLSQDEVGDGGTRAAYWTAVASGRQPGFSNQTRVVTLSEQFFLFFPHSVYLKKIINNYKHPLSRTENRRCCCLSALSDLYFPFSPHSVYLSTLTSTLSKPALRFITKDSSSHKTLIKTCCSFCSYSTKAVVMVL